MKKKPTVEKDTEKLKSEPKKNAAKHTPGKKDFLVVGLGASAGGVKAFQEFFATMPPDSGMAFVAILHLSPEHESNLPQIIQAQTSMKVTQVTETVKVEPNNVYVIPPNQQLEMVDGVIRPNTAIRPLGHRVAIDIFFRTLAEAYQKNAVCVVMSGTGSDGTLGLKRVKESNGFAIVQSPDDAEYDSMPQAAINTQLADWILPINQMPEKLIHFRESSERLHLTNGADGSKVAEEIHADESLREVLTILRVRTGHDFANYKMPTLIRRIARHLQIHELEDIPSYLELLRNNPDEVHSLLKNLLINVTNFFRDREAFQSLEKEVVPHLFAGKTGKDTVRVWSCGCASGEEAYSLAMLLQEFADTLADPPKFQVFASDVDDDAVAEAREHLYPESIETDVSPDRLKRFFVKEGSEYRVKKELRETILFAPHNVLRDPPFSRLDLITCRNLLIYLNRDAQERVLQIFHFALASGGYLFLGGAETADGVGEMFAPVDKKHRLYSRRHAPIAQTGLPLMPVIGRWEVRTPDKKVEADRTRAASLSEIHYRLLENYAPSSVLVNQDFEIVYSSGAAKRFLQFAGGEPSRNLLKVVVPDLLPDLRAALFTAQREHQSSEFPNVRVNLGGAETSINLIVRAVEVEDAASDYLLVIFEEKNSPAVLRETDRVSAKVPGKDEATETVVRRLEEDLQRTREQLRYTIEQHETSVEELKAANEELQAINEELRSSGEELETSKEESQSVNEELTTVNHELKNKIDETGRINSDLQNLMAATDIATIFLDKNLKIKRYTPPVEEFFNITKVDVGRPLEHFTHKLNYDSLAQDAAQVLRKLTPIEREITDQKDNSYLARLAPYRTTDDRIDGVVLNFIDITDRKKAEVVLHESEERQVFLLKLSDIMQKLVQPNEIKAAAARLIGERLGVNRAQYHEVDGSGDYYDADGVGYANGLPLLDLKYRIDDFGTFVGEDFAAGRLFRSDDLAVDPRVSAEERQAYRTYQIRSGAGAPLLRGGKLVAILAIHAVRPRHWTDAEMELIRETAERIWAAVDSSRAEESLRESEEKYRSLFASVDEGFCLIEMIYDRAGEAVDHRFLEINPAFEQLSGLAGVVGKRATEVFPAAEVRPMIERYGRVAETGEPVRFEEYVESIENSWFSIYASRVGGAGSNLIAVVFDNITERKQREQQQEFLLKFSDALRAEESAQAIGTLATRMVARYFEADRSYICRYAQEEGLGWIGPEFKSDGLPPLAGEYRIADFPEGMKRLETEPLIIRDLLNDASMSDADKQSIGDGLGLQAMIAAPLRKGENNALWCFVAATAKPRDWNDGELKFLQEIAERTWTAIERARAEAALRESEEKYRSLFDSIDEGFCVIEVIYDDKGAAVDLRYLEVNQVFERQSGLENAAGKLFGEIVGNIEDYWLEIYDRIARTGEAQRFENYNGGTERWYSIYASRVGGEGSRRLALVFDDITERKRSELNKAFLDEIGQDLALLTATDEIMETVGEKTCQFLHLTGCYFFDVHEHHDKVDVNYGWSAEGVPALKKQTYRLADLVTGEFARACRAGETFVVRNTETDKKTEKEGIAQIGVGAFVTVPFLRNGRWIGHLGVSDSAPHDWRADEIELLQEIAARIFPRIERARAEAALRESEERLRIAAQAARMYSWEFDANSETYKFSENAARILGVATENLPRTVEDAFRLVHPDDREKLEMTLRRALKTGKGFAIDFRSQTDAGGTVCLDVQTAVIKDQRGKPARIVGTAQDVTVRRRAEDALRTSEERLRIAVEAAEMATWDWDLVKDEVVWNEQHFRLFGMKPVKKPLKPKAFSDHVHPDDRGWVVERLNQAVKTKTTFTAEFRAVRDDGVMRWMEGYGHSVEESPDGKATRMSGVMSDVTNRKRAEEAVRLSEERLQLIMRSISDYAIITSDPKGIINGWNTGAENTFGWTAKEAVGQSFAIVFTPEDRAADIPEKEMATARKMGIAEDVRWHIRKDGSRFFASGTVSPIRNGEFDGYVKIASDQTARIAAETALREKETLQKLVTAQEAERKRIARDLHDELGQQLTALRIKLDTVSKKQQEPVLRNELYEIQDIARSIDDGVDFLAFELRPTTLDDLGLIAALDKYIRQWSHYAGVKAELTISNLKRVRLMPEVETCLYRIVQEALNNTHKHARAMNADIVLERRGDTLVLIVEDDGAGFNQKSKMNRTKGIGLIGMRERAHLVGGTFEIETAAKQGTTIYVRLPFAVAREK